MSREFTASGGLNVIFEMNRGGRSVGRSVATRRHYDLILLRRDALGQDVRRRLSNTGCPVDTTPVAATETVTACQRVE